MSAEESRPAIVKAIGALDPEGVADALKNGVDPNLTFQGIPLVQRVLSYSFTDPFGDKFTPEERRSRMSKILEALFEKGADPNVRGRNGQTFLTALAWENGDPVHLELAIGHGAEVDGVNVRGEAPIHLAVSRPGLLRALLGQGADAGLANPKTGRTPLMGALAVPSVEAVKLLLGAGASPVAMDKQGRNAFHHLALRIPEIPEEAGPLSEISVECAALLHSAGTDFQVPDGEGVTAFHLAAANPASGLLKWCIGQGNVPIEVADDAGRTPLGHALEAIEEENIRLLLDAGAKVPATGLIAPVARAYHESRISPDAYEALLKTIGPMQDDIDIADKSGWTALMWAAGSDVTGAVEYLLEKGADPKRRAPDGRTALHFAAASAAAQTAALLLGHGAEIGAVDSKGATPLEWALRWEHREVAETLLAGMPVAQDSFRLALEAGSTTAVDRILKAEPSRVHSEMDGSPPLHLAIRAKNQGLVDLLIEGGADVNDFDQSGFSPLSLAVEIDSPGILERLLAGGADPAGSVKDGSPLIVAAESGRSVALETLLLALPEALAPAESSRLLAVPIKRDDLAWFRFLLHHERLQFSAREDHLESLFPYKLLATANISSDRYLREWIAKADWKPAPDESSLNRLWLRAVEGGNVPVVRFLHETYSVDLEKTESERGLSHVSLAPDPFGGQVNSEVTPLYMAFKSGKPEMVGYLRSSGAKLLGAGENLRKLAEDFARTGKVELLAQALDLLQTTEIGDPDLLMQAASAGQSECVALLLKRGADPAARDSAGKSVLEHAIEGGESTTMRLVRDALP
jgi:ankyrin repeat protein